ncbi:MAG: hypothetical protein V7603_4525 [Micromonosporaceae bacterium]
MPVRAYDGAVEAVVDALLRSPEPAVRWKVRTRVLDQPADGREILALRQQIRESPRVRALLAGARGQPSARVYDKWRGAHWALAALADLGYPPGDSDLYPLRDAVQARWLSTRPPLVAGRYRRCGSQQGNALWYLTVLGLADEHTGDLAERLLHWQWPDGGWNCDRRPAAVKSSFFETLLPMRGLAAHADATGDVAARAGAYRAAEVFLGRHLLYRAGTAELIRHEFGLLHYPLYWYYDVLAGLKGMAQLDLLGDPRCAAALDLLESLRTADGWPAHRRYYSASATAGRHQDHVDWGGAGIRRANEWVTADALAVLHAAGRG